MPTKLSTHSDVWCIRKEACRRNSLDENNFGSGRFKKTKQNDNKITPPGLFFCLSHTVLPLRPHLFITPPTTFHHILPLAVIRADSNGKSDQVAGGRPTSPPSLLAPLLKSPWGPTRPLSASDSTRLGRIDRQPLVKLLKVVIIVIR